MSNNQEIVQEINGFIQRNTVDLVPLNSDHAEIYNKWANDVLIRKYLKAPLPIMLEAKKKNS